MNEEGAGGYYYLWSSTECSGGAVGIQSLLTQAKISEYNVALRVQEDVLWLEISVKKSHLKMIIRWWFDLAGWLVCMMTIRGQHESTPVKDVQGMEVAKTAGNLRSVEPSPGFQENPLSLEVVEELREEIRG